MNGPQDKSSRGTYSNKDPGSYESKRWGHEGYEQLQSEQSGRYYKNSDRGKPYKNQRRYPNDNTMASDLISIPSQEDKSYYNNNSNGKWTHDKFNKVSSTTNPTNATQPAEPWNKDRMEKEKPQKPIRKRPDMQLYSVRDKRGNAGGDPKSSGRREREKEKDAEASKKPQYKEKEAGSLDKDEKDDQGFEGQAYEEDDKSIISNVSTAISDPLKAYEEESSMVKDIKDESALNKLNELKESKKEAQEGNLLFEVTLDCTEKEIVRIFDNEEDYEKLLDDVCQKVGLSGRTVLYLKINIFSIIREMHPNPKKVEEVFNKLVDQNFKLIQEDSQDGDNLILPYIDNDDELLNAEMCLDQREEENEGNEPQ